MPEPPTPTTDPSESCPPNTPLTHAPPETAPADLPGLCSCEFSFEKYRRYLMDERLSEDQQRQLLETLWLILMQMVDLNIPISSNSDTIQSHNEEPIDLEPNRIEQEERAET